VEEAAVPNADNSITTEVSRLLTAASHVLAGARASWLITAGEEDAVNVRPMGGLRAVRPGSWKMLYLADARSRKAADIRRAGQSTVVVQHGDDAFVSVAGLAALLEEASEVRKHWISGYDRYFPTEQDRVNAVLIELDVRRMDLWIRGVTPEPFGLRSTRLAQDADGEWQIRSQPC
jgi:general stress protein 26